jgi:hypothetical protein
VTPRQQAAEAVCEALITYEAVKHDNERQLDAWDAIWLNHKVWRAARAVDNSPTLEGTTDE